MRQELVDLTSYFVTPSTSKHRYFVEVPATAIWDGALFAIAANDCVTYIVLNSRIHVIWALASGGTLEDRPTWTNTTCFNNFPMVISVSKIRVKLFDELKSGHQAIAMSRLGDNIGFNISDRFKYWSGCGNWRTAATCRPCRRRSGISTRPGWFPSSRKSTVRGLWLGGPDPGAGRQAGGDDAVAAQANRRRRRRNCSPASSP